MKPEPKTMTLQSQQPDTSSPADAAAAYHDPLDPLDNLAIRVRVKSARLVVLTVLVVTFVVSFTLCFGRRGVVVETFERSAVSIKQQENMLERYNSYSGTVTAAIERPLQIATGLLVQIVVLRMMAVQVLDADQGWRVSIVALAFGAGGGYLLSNGLSAVNVQVRELPVRSIISTSDLAVKLDYSVTSTMNKSFSEDTPRNPTTNTILRNLILPRAMSNRPVCGDRDSMDAIDAVEYRIPQFPWMKNMLPVAVDAKSMKLDIASANTAANNELTPGQFPMNASVAADLLVYSEHGGSSLYAIWGAGTVQFYDFDLAHQYFHNNSDDADYLYGSTARLTGLLPPKMHSTEDEDRAWFLRHSAPIMYNISESSYKNASLRSWTMTLSHIDIAPSVWVDAITVEREMATPRLVTDLGLDGKTTYFALTSENRRASPSHVSIRSAGGAQDDIIDVYTACRGEDSNPDMLTSKLSVTSDSAIPDIMCANQSTTSLLFLSRGRRLVADALIENASVNASEVVTGGNGVIVNMREIFSSTVAIIRWKTQDLSTVFNAECHHSGGCLGLEAPLSESGQRLVVGADALPLNQSSALFTSGVNNKPLSAVSVRRPQVFSRYRNADGSVFIGDILMPHNVLNITIGDEQPVESCDDAIRNRMITYVDNHIYIESTLQPTYTAAAFFLFQNGVPRDILNQSWTPQTMLAFSSNTQDVDVYVYIPWLNVLLTLGGCAVLVLATAFVLLWPRLRGTSQDPLDHITMPHMVANVLLNDSVFPPTLLARSVVYDGGKAGTNDAAELLIDSLSVQRKNDLEGGRQKADP